MISFICLFNWFCCLDFAAVFFYSSDDGLLLWLSKLMAMTNTTTWSPADVNFSLISIYYVSMWRRTLFQNIYKILYNIFSRAFNTSQPFPLSFLLLCCIKSSETKPVYILHGSELSNKLTPTIIDVSLFWWWWCLPRHKSEPSTNNIVHIINMIN